VGSDAGASGHDAATGPPHESPWPMTVPLVVLAVCAFFGGVLSLPWYAKGTLLQWIDPVFGANLYNAHQSAGMLWTLGTVDAVIAVIGVTVAYRIWATRSEHPQLEPAFLQKAWYINEVFDFAIGRPGTRLAAFAATVVDTRVIDGAVNGIASLVRGTGGALRRVQSGYVRNYALAIAVGIVALLGFMVTRLWWS